MKGHDIADLARDWLGTPYCHQSACKGAGADCLGLILGLWREATGDVPAPLPPYTPDWSEPQGQERLLAAATTYLIPTEGEDAVGQVILFRMRAGSVAKHLGILSQTAPARFIHAYSGQGVVENHLTDSWRRRMVARFTFPFAE